jgi:hypothetical protein
MKKSLFLLSALCLLLAASQALAQNDGGGPPKYFLIEREVLKPGTAPAHERESNNFARLLSNARGVAGETRYYRVGMTPVAGNQNEVIYVFPFNTLDDIAKYNADIERWMSRPGDQNAFYTRIAAEHATPHPGTNDDFHALQTSMIAELVPELSYNERPNPGVMRYVEMTTWRVKPGQDANFIKAGQMVVNAHRQAKNDIHFITYRVLGGALGGTYVTLTTFRTLSELTPSEAERMAWGKAMGDKMSELQKLTGKVFTNMETSVYAVRPTMSAVPDFFMQDSGDRAFWMTTMPEPPATATASNGGARAMNGKRRTRQ